MKTYQYIILSILLVSVSCREPFEPDSIEFLDALVVESTITNELKHHEVKLSRTYALGDSEPTYANNATVWIEDSNNNNYSFSLANDGLYMSDTEFEARGGVSYTLNITTQDGKEYRSTDINLTPASDITNLYAEVVTKDNGDQGIQVMIDNNNPNEQVQYLKYEYEETYKLVAPFWNPYEAILTNYEETGSMGLIFVFFDTDFVLREEQERVCYTTIPSVGILQTSTSALENNNIERFPIRFILINDGVLRDRYSILVKQYSQSLEAYSYYNTLNELGDNESILSQNQPGYVMGNMSAINNENEKVIGYFEASTFYSKRIYFNYSDFQLPKPDYIFDCELIELDYTINSACGPCEPPITNKREQIYRLLTTFQEENYNYLITEIPQPIEGFWKITNPECGDCTTVGTNVEPNFWED